MEATAVIQERVDKSLDQDSGSRDGEKGRTSRKKGQQDLLVTWGGVNAPHSSPTSHCDFLTMSPWKAAIRWEIEKIMGCGFHTAKSLRTQKAEGDRGTRC